MDWDAATDSDPDSDFTDKPERLSDGETADGETADREMVDGDLFVEEEDVFAPVQVGAERATDVEKRLENTPGALVPVLTTSDITPRRRRQLFNGNAKPAEFYRETIKTFNRDDYLRSRYADKTIREMNSVQEEWCE